MGGDSCPGSAGGEPCFRFEHYQTEIDHLVIARSPAYHYEPETNGCAEKFIQTLKEQVLWVERFQTFEALRSGTVAVDCGRPACGSDELR